MKLIVLCGIGTQVLLRGCIHICYVSMFVWLVVRNIGGKYWKDGGVDCHKGRGWHCTFNTSSCGGVRGEGFLFVIIPPLVLCWTFVFHILMWFITVAGGQSQTTMEDLCNCCGRLYIICCQIQNWWNSVLCLLESFVFMCRTLCVGRWWRRLLVSVSFNTCRNTR